MPNGIFPAAPIEPAPYGLLSAADVVRPNDTNWVRGFSAELNSRPQVVRILSESTGNVPNGTVYEAGDDNQQFTEVEPFFIETTVKTSGINNNFNSERAKLLQQLNVVTGKAVEYELWTGVAAIADGSDQLYLQRDGAATIIGGTAGVTPKKALAIIEGAIADSPTGAGGVIHVTREMGSMLTLQGAIKPVGEGDEEHLETVLGTKVVVGTGYTGDGPGAANGATDSAQWMYATGPVSVLLGEAEVVNEDIGRSFTPGKNDVELVALRAASVYFDPSIFYAVKVTIPDTP